MKKFKYKIITEKNKLGEIRFSAKFITSWHSTDEDVKWYRNLGYNFFAETRDEIVDRIYGDARARRGTDYEVVVTEEIEA